MLVMFGGDETRPCEAIKEETSSFAVRGANHIAIAEKR
jgi:hypothetical protein